MADDNRRFIPLTDFREYPPEQMQARAGDYLQEMRRRRSVRQFSDRSVPEGVIKDCVLTAGTAPSGANRQPWHFVVVSDPELKRKIRESAEQEEREFYGGRAPREWLEALEPMGTDDYKPFLQTAPALIVIFAEMHGQAADGTKTRNYYVTESVGIATGMLISALHHAGLATLTHTPSPMRFLNEILGRPRHERPYMVLVAGYPAEGARVPDIRRKSLETIATFR